MTFAERLKLDARGNGQVLRGPEQIGIKADGCADATGLQYVRNPPASVILWSAWPGWISTGASTLRSSSDSRTTSPVARFRSDAVSALISAALSQVSFVMGSGISWSQLRFANRPSKTDASA